MTLHPHDSLFLELTDNINKGWIINKREIVSVKNDINACIFKLTSGEEIRFAIPFGEVCAQLKQIAHK